MVRRSEGHGALSHKVVCTWIGDCLRTGKPSRYINNTVVNLAFHPSSLTGWDKGGVAGNTV